MGAAILSICAASPSDPVALWDRMLCNKPLRLRVFFVANLLQHGQMSTMVNFRVGLTRIKMSICSSTLQDHGGYTVV